MRLSLADWLRRLADRVAPRTARAGARAGFNDFRFYAMDMDEALQHWRKRGGGAMGYTGK